MAERSGRGIALGPALLQKGGSTEEAQESESTVIITAKLQVNSFLLSAAFGGASGTTRFRVVAAVGRQASGKSTVLNSLFGTSFRTADVNCLHACTRGVHLDRTNGVHLLAGVQEGRTLVLDTEALTSVTVLSELRPLQGLTARLRHELRALKVLLWLFIVCHTVIVVEDAQEERSAVPRLLQMAEALATGLPDVAAPRARQGSQHFPSVVFVQNKTPQGPPGADRLAACRRELEGRFRGTRVATNALFNHSSAPAPATRETVSLCSLPFANRGRGHEAYDAAVEELREELLSCMPQKFSRGITEREWATNAAAVWEAVHELEVLDDLQAVWAGQR